MNNDKKIRNQYNNFDEIYSNNLAIQNDMGNRFLYQAIDFSLKGKTVLDIGSGDGNDCNNYQKAGAKVFGIEPSKDFRFAAQKKYPKCEFFSGVGEDLPFNDKTFDVVFSNYAIQTSLEVPKVMREVGRVLKTGGLFVFLSKHPFRQLLEQNDGTKNYFKQNKTTSRIFDGKIILTEPSHSFGEYFNKGFFDLFNMVDYKEWYDFPASEQLAGNIYPTFFVLKAKRKASKSWYQKKPVQVKNFQELTKTYNKKYGNYNYATDSRALDKKFVDTILKSVGNVSNSNMLVCGANNGYEIKIINTSFPSARFFAVDIADEALQRISAALSEVQCVHANMEKLPFKDKQFDVYLNCRAIHSSDVNIKNAVNEAIRVTKGKIIISIANGYVFGGQLVNGMYDYKASRIDTEKPKIILKQIKEMFNRQNKYRLTELSSEAELFLIATPKLYASK